ncbi:MAG: FkbM family methyltransferase [Pseudomonadota bacterium]
MFEKLKKLAALLPYSLLRSALVQHRVAATTEHFEAIRFVSPASVIDVGANKGQFSLAVKALFPSCVIHAFEPLDGAAELYKALFGPDPSVTLHRLALGANAGNATLHVASREDSSSLLAITGNQTRAYGIKAKTEAQVQIKRLDAALNIAALPRPRFLKIDVQGTELEVLKGVGALNEIDFIYVELSFVALYRDQALFEDVHAFLNDKGFSLRGVFNVSNTKAFGPTQIDALYCMEK